MDPDEQTPLKRYEGKDQSSYHGNESQNPLIKDGSSPDGGFCSRLYPMGFFQELKGLLKMSAPLIAQQLTMYMLGPVALIFCGHLGKMELDAVALACSILNVFGISAAVGLSSACDTLFSQVYGSESKHKLGIILQRSLLFLGLSSLPCIAIHINAEALCRLLGQNIDVARMAGEYMLVLLPGTFCFFFYIALLKYIQNQNIIIPTLIIGAIVNVLNAVLHYLLVYVAAYGIMGSAVSQSICYCLFLVLTVGYTLCTGLHKETWNGWDRECLQNWGQFLYLAVFGLLMICIEWWSFEAGIFLAGLLGTAELGAQSLVMQVEIVLYMFPLGNGIAASIRVGQFLGSGDAKSACTSARVAITFIGIMGIVLGILMVILKDILPLIFSSDADVIAVASTIFPVMGVYMLFDCVAGTCAGILRGSGTQRLGAAIVFCGYFAALAIGVPLMFLTPLKVPGFWIALAIALCFDSIIFFTYIMRIDWEKEAILAYDRVSMGLSKSNRKYSAVLEDGEQRNLLSSSNIHNHMSVSVSHNHDDHSNGHTPIATVICRRLIAAMVMVALLVVGIVLRVAIIELDYPTETTTNTTIANSSTTELLYSTVTATLTSTI